MTGVPAGAAPGAAVATMTGVPAGAAPGAAGRPAGAPAWADRTGYPAMAAGWHAPRPPSVLHRRWPGPRAGAPRAVVGSVAAAAAVAAVTIPLSRPGLGWLLAGIAGTAALVVAAWSANGRPAAADSGQPAATDGGQSTGTSATQPSEPATRPDATATASTGTATATATATGTGTGTGTGQDPAAPANRQHPGTDAGQVTGPAVGRLRRIGPTRPLWALATLALLAVGTVRAAGWLFVLCLLTAGVTAALTVADGRSLRGLLLSGLIPLAAVLRALPWAARGLNGPQRPEGGGRFGRTFGAVAVSLLLLLVFGLLLSSADAAFAVQLDRVLPDLSVPVVFRWIFLFVAVGAGLIGAAYVLAAPPDLTGLAVGTGRGRLRRFEWMLPVALLDLLFAGFVAVQLTTLFGGDDHVLRTAGLTYAEYARSGFWQLLAVSVLVLLVIGAAGWWAPRNGRTDRVLIRLLLGALTLLSLVIVGSALYRMDVYADAYGATRLRLLVAVCELWIGLLFVLVAAAGIRLTGAWLPRLAVGTAVLALLGLAIANPDRLIAERNVDLWAKTGRIDIWYLSGLSADAVPALDRLPESLRRCALTPIFTELAERGDANGFRDNRRERNDDWHEFNLGRAEARRILTEHPVPSARSSMSLPSTGCS
ncbi:DUF4153 domain-containing protein [Plantactinospora sonchi]|uniref:DUF4173 domain-containing protein n=1 Tax=Plantactinospora sonchi TaxID=1544735 RepID=A0ABU7RPB0_9ACTN